MATGQTAVAGETPVQRALVADGLLNVRDLGGLPTGDGRRVRSGLVVRSDNLRSLTPAGAAALARDVAPRLVIDLRTEAECAHEGVHAPAGGPSGLGRYLNIPLQPQAALTPQDVAAGGATTLLGDYLLHLERSPGPLLRGFALLAEPDGLPVVVHCTAGKDRTGVFVALLLDLLGVDPDAVVADYAETAANMDGVLARIRSSPFFRSNGLATAPAWLFAAEPETMREFLRVLHERHGGAGAWAGAHGQPAGVVDRLRSLLLEDVPR